MEHLDIRRFEVSGIIGDDKDIIRLRGEFERLMIRDMRDQGYVPHLELAPVFTITYNGHYEFRLSMYGAFVGVRASELEGVDGFGKFIYRRASRGNIE